MKLTLEEFRKLREIPFVNENSVWPASYTEVSHESQWGATVFLKIENAFANGHYYFLLTPPAALQLSKILRRAVKNYLRSAPDQEPNQPMEIEFPKERFISLAESDEFLAFRPIFPISMANATYESSLGDAIILLQINNSYQEIATYFLMTPPTAVELSKKLRRTVDDYLTPAQQEE